MSEHTAVCKAAQDDAYVAGRKDEAISAEYDRMCNRALTAENERLRKALADAARELTAWGAFGAADNARTAIAALGGKESA